jgi:hypothetical protein
MNSKVITAWVVGGGALLLLAVIVFQVEHHAHFARDGLSIDALPEFFEVYGLACGLLLVLVAKVLAVALKRKDSFYADD